MSKDGVIHVIAQPFGWGAHALGAVYDYATPGKGQSTLTNVGAAITDPNRVFTGPSGPGVSSWQTTSQINQHAIAPTNNYPPHANAGKLPQAQNNGGYLGDYSSTGGGTSDQGLTPDQRAYYGKLFDTQIGNLQSQQGQLQQAHDIANLQFQQQYQGKMNDLQTQHDRGIRDLGTAANQIQLQKAQSLNDLAHQVEQMGMSYNNQLGSLGAGNSSAAGLINRAVAQQAARNRGQVMQSAGSQLGQINTQRGDLETDFGTQKQALDQWKQGQLYDLINNYNDQMAKLQEAIANAQGQKAQALAQYQPQLVQQAIDGLTQLQNVYNQNHQSLLSRFQNAAAPNVAINPNLMSFETQQITPGQVANVPGAAPIQNQAFDPVSAILKRRDENGNPIVPIGG